MMSALLARLVLTVFILHSTVDATNTCDIKPRLIELNTTAANASLRLQLAASQGNAPQDFHLGFSISENNTIVAAARACSDFYTTYGFATPEACNSAMGGVLAVDAGGDNARKDVAVKVPTLGVTMEDYTITLLSEENKDYNRTAIGLVGYSLSFCLDFRDLMGTTGFEFNLHPTTPR